MSQKAEILRYLKTGRTLTADEAKRWFGCERLASRIGELKKDGYEIEAPLVEVSSGKHVARYSLKTKHGQLALDLEEEP